MVLIQKKKKKKYTMDQVDPGLDYARGVER